MLFKEKSVGCSMRMHHLARAHVQWQLQRDAHSLFISRYCVCLVHESWARQLPNLICRWFLRDWECYADSKSTWYWSTELRILSSIYLFFFSLSFIAKLIKCFAINAGPPACLFNIFFRSFWKMSTIGCYSLHIKNTLQIIFWEQDGYWASIGTRGNLPSLPS